MQNAVTARRIIRSVQVEMALSKQAIGRRIAQLRGDVSQADLADALGVSERAVQDWEYGVSEPRPRNRRKLAAHFGVSEDLFLVERPATPDPFAQNGNTPDILGRLERIEQLLVDLTQRFEEDITAGVLPRLDELATRDGEPESTPTRSAPTPNRRAQPT